MVVAAIAQRTIHDFTSRTKVCSKVNKYSFNFFLVKKREGGGGGVMVILHIGQDAGPVWTQPVFLSDCVEDQPHYRCPPMNSCE